MCWERLLQTERETRYRWLWLSQDVVALLKKFGPTAADMSDKVACQKFLRGWISRGGCSEGCRLIAYLCPPCLSLWTLRTTILQMSGISVKLFCLELLQVWSVLTYSDTAFSDTAYVNLSVFGSNLYLLSPVKVTFDCSDTYTLPQGCHRKEADLYSVHVLVNAMVRRWMFVQPENPHYHHRIDLGRSAEKGRWAEAERECNDGVAWRGISVKACVMDRLGAQMRLLLLLLGVHSHHSEIPMIITTTHCDQPSQRYWDV